MTITLSLAAATFLLGIAIGAAAGPLLRRFQWAAFKERVSQELRDQLWAARSAEPRPAESSYSNPTTFLATSWDDSLPATPAPLVGEHISSEIIDPAVRTLLEQKQLEIARLQQEIMTLRVVIPLLEDDPDSIERYEQGDRSELRPILQIRYGLTLSPRRAQ